MAFKEIYNSQRLIDEIKRRPGLYDCSSAMYTDKEERSILWEEVCEAVVDNWRTLDKGEKALNEVNVQRRWKSLRDCFKRELLLQEKFRRSGMSLKRKKKYLYFDSLSFLSPNVRSGRNNSTSKQNISNKSGTQSKNIEMADTSKDSTADEDVKDIVNNPEIQTFNIASPQISEKQTHSLETDLTYVENHGKDVDDDKAFLVSLLPTLRTFNSDQKFNVRMLMMDVIRQVQLGHNPRLVTYPNELVNSDLCDFKLSPSDRSIKVESVEIKSEEDFAEEIEKSEGSYIHM